MDESRCRQIVAERATGLCEAGIATICHGKPTNMSHRKARGQGGEWTPANIMHLCGSGTTGCHGWVEHHPNAARARGLRLRGTDDVTRVPVLMRTGQLPPAWWMLDDDGCLTWVEDITEAPTLEEALRVLDDDRRPEGLGALRR